MPDLYLFGEGKTEQTFADVLLKPHLAQFGVWLQGCVDLEGRNSYTRWRKEIGDLLKQRRQREVHFSSLLDLYKIPAAFPGLQAAEALRHLPRERTLALEKSFAADIGDPRFMPHLQMHEYEAYLFADIAQMEYFYSGRPRPIAALVAVAAETEPELINDGEQTAPSKRIEAHFPKYAKAKPRVGPRMAERIGLAAIRAKCPHFAAWLARLEALGGPAASA